jgi:hypothetical protein
MRVVLRDGWVVACLLLVATLVTACGDATGPERVALTDITRTFTAERFTTTTGGSSVDQLKAGATVTLALGPDGKTSGRLFVPNGGEGGGNFDADLAGTFAFDEASSRVALAHAADTFLRDMIFDAAREDGVVRLEGTETFGGTTVRLTLRGQ